MDSRRLKGALSGPASTSHLIKPVELSALERALAVASDVSLG
jgi:hypothetical protein